MATAPLVSVVITSYNYARYLRTAIDSVLKQTYRRVELVVVDDGSTDGSQAIIAEYGGRCVAVLRDNGGEAAACNSGFAACGGDIVMFLDSDDFLYPEAVELVVNAWSAGVAKVQFYLDAVDAEGRPRGHRLPNIPFAADGEIRALLGRYGYYPAPPTSGNAFSRQVLARLMPAPEGVWRRGVDGYHIALSPLYGLVVSLHRSLGAYRIHDQNMSAVSTLDLAKLRWLMAVEFEREHEIKRHAAALGHEIGGPLALRIPAHCKARIVSLRLDRAGHPVRGDRIGRLVLAGIVAAWRFPHSSAAKRLLSVLGFMALPLLPRSWLVRRLQQLFLAERRPSWIGGLAAPASSPGDAAEDDDLEACGTLP